MHWSTIIGKLWQKPHLKLPFLYSIGQTENNISFHFLKQEASSTLKIQYFAKIMTEMITLHLGYYHGHGKFIKGFVVNVRFRHRQWICYLKKERKKSYQLKIRGMEHHLRLRTIKALLTTFRRTSWRTVPFLPSMLLSFEYNAISRGTLSNSGW